MIAAGAAIGDRRRGPRVALLSTIGAAHLLAIWLMLQPSAPRAVATSPPPLALFDVAPPLPPPEPPPPPPPPSPPPRIAERVGGGGGSPGIRRERAAAMVDRPAPPARESMDATPTLPTSLPPPALAAGTAPLDLGGGGANGIGTGSGSGAGPGDGSGRGRGSGDGSDDVYARADWVEKPDADVWRRNWPRGRGLAQTVTVRLSCKVRRNGRPYSCRIRSEQPSRMGFGITALAVLRESRVRPVARNGDAQWDLPVMITLVFNAIENAPRIPATMALP